jgi:hypothetical protein
MHTNTWLDSRSHIHRELQTNLYPNQSASRSTKWLFIPRKAKRLFTSPSSSLVAFLALLIILSREKWKLKGVSSCGPSVGACQWHRSRSFPLKAMRGPLIRPTNLLLLIQGRSAVVQDDVIRLFSIDEGDKADWLGVDPFIDPFASGRRATVKPDVLGSPILFVNRCFVRGQPGRVDLLHLPTSRHRRLLALLEIGGLIAASERQRQEDGDEKTDEKFFPDHSGSASESVSPPKNINATK